MKIDDIFRDYLYNYSTGRDVKMWLMCVNFTKDIFLFNERH